MKRLAIVSFTSLISLLLVGALIRCAPTRAETDPSDPFRPYLTGRPPSIVRTLGEQSIGKVLLRRVVFHSRTVQTKEGPRPSEVFALIARPTTPGPHPGLLVLHGGRGAAEQAKAIGWAARGYVVVAPDLPGIADPVQIPYSTGAWKGAYEQKYISATPDVTASPIFDGVLAAVQSLYLLRAQPDVLAGRIGVVGISWGGYAATMVAGMEGGAVRAVFSVFGSGFYDRGSGWQERLSKLPKGEMEAWLKYLDAGRRAQGIKGNYFVAAATNDAYYWPPAVMATLENIPGAKNQLFAPNAAHEAPVPGGMRPPPETSTTWLDMEVDYFAYQLKGEGRPFPTIILEKLESPGPEGVLVRFSVQSVTLLSNVSVYYSTKDQPWPRRTWIRSRAMPRGGGRYEAMIPAAAATKGVDWFALASDTRPVTVSSGIARVGTPEPEPVK